MWPPRQSLPLRLPPMLGAVHSLSWITIGRTKSTRFHLGTMPSQQSDQVGKKPAYLQFPA